LKNDTAGYPPQAGPQPGGGIDITSSLLEQIIGKRALHG
jgi:hypothetical protein